MSDNPFSSPSNDFMNRPANAQGGGRLPGLAYVNQITVIAILTLVQGALLLVMTIATIGYGFLISNLEEFQEVGPDQAMAQQVMFWTVIGIASVVAILAVMHIAAGCLALQFKGRIFSIVTFVCGLASLLTCYCGLTGIGLCVYGMIIFLNPAVSQAFEMAASGMSKQEILKKFY